METLEKIPTIEKSVENSFKELPKVFGAFTLCLMVRKKMREHNRYPMDGTILRRLRELREKGKCVYKVIDTTNAIYQKV